MRKPIKFASNFLQVCCTAWWQLNPLTIHDHGRGGGIGAFYPLGHSSGLVCEKKVAIHVTLTLENFEIWQNTGK